MAHANLTAPTVFQPTKVHPPPLAGVLKHWSALNNMHLQNLLHIHTKCYRDSAHQNQFSMVDLIQLPLFYKAHNKLVYFLQCGYYVQM
jgi:hypothetical protein